MLGQTQVGPGPIGEKNVKVQAIGSTIPNDLPFYKVGPPR